MNLVEEILKIEQIQQERKIKNKLLNYNTGAKINTKQVAFHECPKKNRWVFGGNRSGKTECGAVEVVYMARGCHPFRNIKKATSGWVVSLSQQVQRDVAQSKILNYLNPDWVEDVVMLSGRKDNYQNGVIDYILVKNIFGTIPRNFSVARVSEKKHNRNGCASFICERAVKRCVNYFKTSLNTNCVFTGILKYSLSPLSIRISVFLSTISNWNVVLCNDASPAAI